jgi:O-antigen/teichoic acid export membrane protein
VAPGPLDGADVEAGAAHKPVDAAAATTGSSVLTGSMWNLTARLLPQAYTLVLSVVAARFLGPDGMGRQSFIAFAGFCVTLVCSNGLGMSLGRYIGEALGAGRHGQVRDLLRTGWLIQVPVAALGGVGLGLVGILGGAPKLAWLLVGASGFVVMCSGVPEALLVGAQRWRGPSLVTLTTSGLGVPATILVLSLGGGISGMFAVELVVLTANLACFVVMARRTLSEVAGTARAEPGPRRAMLKYAVATTGGLVLTIVVWYRSEFFFLERYSTDSQIAYFSIAFGAVTLLVFVPRAIGETIAPALATLFGAGAGERLRSAFSRALRLVLLVSLPLTAAALALGPAVVELVYGSDYSPVGPMLMIMAALLPIVALFSISESLMIGLGNWRAPLALQALAAIVTLALDFVLISGHAGVGASIAKVCGQLVATLPLLLYAARIAGPIGWEPAALARMAVVSALSGAAGYACVLVMPTGLDAVAGTILGAAVFCALAFVVRPLPADDAEWLAGSLGNRLGGRAARACRRIAGAAATTG